jgi:hypothetical protein
VLCLLTDCDWLDPDALLEVCIGSIVGVFGLEDSLPTEGIDEGCSTWLPSSDVIAHARAEAFRTSARCAANHQTELNASLDILLPP